MEFAEILRLTFFLAVFALCASWEWLFPRKARTRSRWLRWPSNLGLVALNSVILAIVMPILAIEAASLASQSNFGVLNWLDSPLSVNIVLSVLLLDCLIYWQHRMFHKIPLLWRLHRVHHADRDIDVTTGARFHPIEIWLSMWIKISAIMVLGVSPIAVLIFEILLNGSAMFNHSNGYLPKQADRIIRKLVVTPDFHRVHHSVIPNETHSNFGFFLSIWDYLFTSYLAQPKKGHRHVEIGLPIFKDVSEQRLDRLLTQPFRNQ
ncbi:sterol desaturase family protein [Vibrio sp. ZSDZ34]|jgi:sterol desaturase/sphingolipid hydroxylase (fatty acid hydroxylase superfamily)|uniref:Sterol desaturase family protein n=1 Tax=Vibrio gelatinilyticus TaxID=2893468 RepID=A0A9X1WAE0_9VIBR|nr:sterol desaturase family protein [Vibrio gelatinilyticus]MCJ2376651.1 sterol desaturase family protein [Vibrio gelatinilyticus]